VVGSTFIPFIALLASWFLLAKNIVKI